MSNFYPAATSEITVEMKFLERKSNLRILYFFHKMSVFYLLQLQHLVASVGGPLSLGFHPLGVVMVVSWQSKIEINKMIFLSSGLGTQQAN